MEDTHPTKPRNTGTSALPATQFSQAFPSNSLLHASTLSHIAAHHQMQTLQHAPPSPTTVMKSHSIPINSTGMKRTPSELKLREDEELADFRDYVMFRRIVDRISRQQEQTKDLRLRRENGMCLAHVIDIRNGSEDHQSRQRYMISDFLPLNTAEERYGGGEVSDVQAVEDDIFVMDF